MRCEALDTVRIGFIGVGARGQRAVERMMNIEGTKVVALCDFIDKNLEASCAIVAKYGGEVPITLKGEEGWRTLCEREDVDLIYICTDWVSHASIATYALNGFHPFAGYIATMSFYFLLGGILHKNREKLKKIRAFWGIPMILAGLCLAYATRYVTALTNPIFDIVFDAYNTNGTLLCALGTWLLAGKVNFSFLQKVKLLPLIRCISENTLTIFYTHWILGSLIRKFCTYPVGHLWNLLHGVLLVSVGTLLGLALKRIPLLKHLITR